jgi:ribose 5-phosphate isomerase A
VADLEDLKRAAAEASLKFVKPGMILGLGTGSTARHVLEGIARLVRSGVELQGVPTSLATAEAARLLGIPLTSMEEHPRLDLAIDGADEVVPNLDLIKGLGGALFREKIVAAASRKFVVVVDESKLVRTLGSKAPVPVEIHPFGWKATVAAIKALGARPNLRMAGGTAYRTDNGNHIVDAAFGPIRSPRKLASSLEGIPGVVGHGLFLGLTDIAVVGTQTGVRTMRRSRRTT